MDFLKMHFKWFNAYGCGLLHKWAEPMEWLCKTLLMYLPECTLTLLWGLWILFFAYYIVRIVCDLCVLSLLNCGYRPWSEFQATEEGVKPYCESNCAQQWYSPSVSWWDQQYGGVCGRFKGWGVFTAVCRWPRELKERKCCDLMSCVQSSPLVSETLIRWESKALFHHQPLNRSRCLTNCTENVF